MLITIDGPAGAGKTTVSKFLAGRLSYIYVDTGALYRGVAVAVQSKGIVLSNESDLENLCKNLDLKFVNSKNSLRLILNHIDITDKIRMPEITMLASAVSAIPVVRKSLLKIQRNIGQKKGTIFEGRDMGTIVFPDADIKFFLDAAPQIRARRRYNELKHKTSQSFEQIAEDMRLRDKNDSTRKIAPLRPAEDAIIINSSDMSIHQVVEQMLSKIKNINVS